MVENTSNVIYEILREIYIKQIRKSASLSKLAHELQRPPSDILFRKCIYLMKKKDIAKLQTNDYGYKIVEIDLTKLYDFVIDNCFEYRQWAKFIQKRDPFRIVD